MSLTTNEEALLRELLAKQDQLLSLADSESTILSKLGATKVSLSELPAASSLNDDDILLVRQDASDKSVTANVIKTFLDISAASTTSKGIVELATSTETTTGTDTTRAVTPAGLAALTATESRAGIVEIATDAESQALTDDSKIITALKLATAFQGSNVRKTGYGYQKLPSGIIIQWMLNSLNPGDNILIFPIAFPAVCAAVSCLQLSTILNHSTPTPSQINVQNSHSSPVNVYHIMIGY